MLLTLFISTKAAILIEKNGEYFSQYFSQGNEAPFAHKKRRPDFSGRL
jgi:hypothetical protein